MGTWNTMGNGAGGAGGQIEGLERWGEKSVTRNQEDRCGPSQL